MIPWINEGKHLCDQIQVELHDVEFEKQFIYLFVHETRKKKFEKKGKLMVLEV